MLTLREYQLKAIADLRAAFRAGFKAPLFVGPPGMGKTVLFSFMASEAQARGNQVLILAHRDELLDQISDTLTAFQVPHSFIAAGRSFDPRAKCHVGGVQTVARRLDRIPQPAIIIPDEAHHFVPQTSGGRILRHYPQAYRIGVTGTPCRLSGEALSLFDTLVMGPTTAELIALGHLSQYRIFAPSTVDISGVALRGGDYANDQLAVRVDRPTITGDAVREYHARGNGRTLVFCASVTHARHVAEQFTAQGYAAASVDGSLDRWERKAIMSRFRLGTLQILTSCNLISEGLDIPSVETVILLRPTASKALHLQQIGRALRPSDGKVAVVLDHVGNTALHGFPDDPQDWTLAGRTRRMGVAPVSVRTCPKCFACMRSGVTSCIYCATPLPTDPRVIAEKEGQLIELERQQVARTRKMEESHCRTYEDWLLLARQRGHNPAWARIRHEIRTRRSA